MPTLNDILTANGDYTPVSGYPVDDKYEDDSPVINVYDRTIGEIVGDTSTSGENVSQYLTFRIPRHPDHYDLIENGTNIRILYRLEDDTGEDVVPVNVVANEDYIIFGWKIPLVVTVNPGVVTFIIHAYKSENNIITYHYKTLPKTYMILETMETDVVVPEIEMYNLAEAYARGTITDVFGQTRPVEEGDPGYHDNSKYYKELAGTSKTAAETAKNAAEAAQVAAETAQQAAEDARDQAVAIVGGEYVSYGQTQSLNDTQKNKARENIEATGPNGYYPNMTVGLSENFVGTGEPTRRTFNYDTAGGSADISDGNAEIEKMYGDTIVWNQLVKPEYIGASKTENGITFTNNGDGTVTVSGTATANTSLTISENSTTGSLKNKPFILTGCPKGGSVDTYFIGVAATSNVFKWDKGDGYYSADGYGYGYELSIHIMSGTVIDTPITFKPNLFIINTSIFPSLGIFKQMFPKDYYEYNEGTLLNVNPAGIKTVGFNAYDKATGKAELIGGNQYQITGTYTSLSYSTGEVLTPDSTGCFTPTKTGELTVTGGGENTCVHLTWSGYRNGDYEDYWTKTRDINIQPYFPDGLKRAGNVYDEISKDKAIKRIGVVDLGTLDWVYENNSFRTIDLYGIVKNYESTQVPNILTAKYVAVPYETNWTNGMISFTYGSGTRKLVINDSSYTDAAAFKAAMSGVMLYYELATPVETQIDPPLNLLYQVSDFGTEQFLGAGATEPKTLPIIADIVYGVNYRDTIKNLPKNYAKVRGYYPDLYTGLSDNLIDRKGNGTPQEISYRTSCGDDSIADDGNGIIQSIFGKTVVWNQVWNYEKTLTEAGVTYTYENHFYDVVKNTTENNGMYVSHKFQPNNKYYVSCEASSNDNIKLSVTFGNSLTVELTESNKRYKDIITTNTSRSVIYIYSPSGIACTYRVGNIKIVNLTQMFGAGNEPSTLDDPRIKWIKDCANEYPEYNSGELISYNGSGIKTVGFNQWDEEWEVGNINAYDGKPEVNTTNWRSKNFIRIVPSASYYIYSPTNKGVHSIRARFYDANQQYISTTDKNGADIYTERLFIVPDNAHYMKFAPYNSEVPTHELCINLSWSGYRNGEYEPYWSRTLNLPISTYFPDGMKSAGSVRDELTKDKAVKRIGVVDLGTLEWTLNATGRFYAMLSEIAKPTGSYDTKANLLCNRYDNITQNQLFAGTKGIATQSLEGTSVYVYDSAYTDATAFKEAMSGVMLYYELAEPIETTITPPLDLTYKVADFGTEESIAEGKSTPFIGIIKYSDDFTRGLVNMPKNYDTTASLDALAASLSAMLTSALDGTVTITRGEYDPATKKYEWSCQFTKNQVN